MKKKKETNGCGGRCEKANDGHGKNTRTTGTTTRLTCREGGTDGQDDGQQPQQHEALYSFG